MNELKIMKKRCNISGDFKDEEISGYIETAYFRMQQRGINIAYKQNDPLIRSAVECFIKAEINFDNRGEWFEKQFEKRLGSLAMDVDYAGGGVNA